MPSISTFSIPQSLQCRPPGTQSLSRVPPICTACRADFLLVKSIPLVQLITPSAINPHVSPQNSTLRHKENTTMEFQSIDSIQHKSTSLSGTPNFLKTTSFRFALIHPLPPKLPTNIPHTLNPPYFTFPPTKTFSCLTLFASFTINQCSLHNLTPPRISTFPPSLSFPIIINLSHLPSTISTH